MSDSTTLTKNTLGELQTEILKLKYTTGDTVDILCDYECFADSASSTARGKLPSCYIEERQPMISGGVAAIITLLGAVIDTSADAVKAISKLNTAVGTR